MVSSGDLNRVAIVGASSLRGKELKQVLEDRNFPSSDIVLLDESVMAGTLTEAGGEPTFIRELDEDSFEGVRFAFFAGTLFDAERNWQAAQRAGATVIDLTGAVAASDRAISWIPSLDTALPMRPSSANGSAVPAPYISPSSPVIIACTMAAGLAKFEPARIALVLFPPVSERDQPGIEELESQTTNLLTFRPIEQTVFDVQVAFNLLSRYGAESKPAFADIRNEIVGGVSRYLAGRASVPAIQLVQAPVFYGYAFSAFAELTLASAASEEIAAALTSLGVTISAPADPAPTNVSVAGESQIQLASIERDAGVPAGYWFWGVADHLRLAATNAVRIAEELLAKSTAA